MKTQENTVYDCLCDITNAARPKRIICLKPLLIIPLRRENQAGIPCFDFLFLMSSLPFETDDMNAVTNECYN